MARRALFLSIAFVIIVFDRFTKHLVEQKLALYHSIPVIPGFFSLTHVRNRGAAFSILADSSSPYRTVFLIGFSAVSVIILVWLLWKPSGFRLITGISLALILGGAAGNLYDRVVYGEVVDFLLFYFRQWEWPAFNVADSAIVVGCLLLIAEVFFPVRHKRTVADRR